MKEIQLTQDKSTMVDDANFDYLNQFNWYASKERNSFYACRVTQANKIKTRRTMRRQILGLSCSDSKQVDHIDGNGLNNQRSNLRVCTNQQNQYNQRPQTGRSSRFKGVSWKTKDKRWAAGIRHNKKDIWIGNFKIEKVLRENARDRFERQSTFKSSNVV